MRITVLLAAASMSFLGVPAAAAVRHGAAPAQAAGTYTVVAGDYLYGIAAKTGTPINTLLSLNGLTLRSTIHPGQVLRTSPSASTRGANGPTPPATTPSAPTYTVVRGDSLYGIASTTRTPINTLLSLNGLTLRSVIYPGQRLRISGATTVTNPPTTPADPSERDHAFPFASPGSVWYARDQHRDYPAADVFVTTGCGTAVLSPARGTVDGVERNNPYVASADDPALRGGNWVSILGRDGVRYYLAHLQSVDGAITPGVSVAPGQRLGTLGSTGRSGGCHTHIGLSPGSCSVSAWWVRRGVIWPASFLDAWRSGQDVSPAAAVNAWLDAHQGACTNPAATGFRTG